MSRLRAGAVFDHFADTGRSSSRFAASLFRAVRCGSPLARRRLPRRSRWGESTRAWSRTRSRLQIAGKPGNLFDRRTRPIPAAGAGLSVRPPARRTASDSRRSRVPEARFARQLRHVGMLVEQDHVQPACHAGLDPERLLKSAEIRVDTGLVRADRARRPSAPTGWCLGSSAWSSRNSVATSRSTRFQWPTTWRQTLLQIRPPAPSDVGAPIQSRARM